MKEELDYQKDVSIDDSALDVEWLGQASLTFKYSQIKAEAGMAVDHAKTHLDLVKAELDLEIRNDPESFNIPKVTEGAISSTILTLKKFKIAIEAYHKAQYELNVAWAAVNAIQDKKTALENLVKLHGQNYFAGPKLPRDLGYEWEQRQRQISSNKKVKITRRTK